MSNGQSNAFILFYADGQVKLDNFNDIKRVIDARGQPSAIQFKLEDLGDYAVNLVRGHFVMGDQIIEPVDGEGVPLTDLKIPYRLIWARRWYRTIRLGGQPKPGEPAEPEPPRWAYRLGWQITLCGKNIKRALMIHEDGRVGM